MTWKRTFCMFGAVLLCTALIAGPALAEEKPLEPATATPSGQDPEEGPGGRETILVRIFTDNYGSETTWDITQQGGGVVASGGPYDYYNPTLYEIPVSVSPTACYDFCIYDSWGDGICCAYGDGWYEVLYQGAVVGSGGVFGSVECVYNIGGGCGATIGVTIFTDDYGNETTWDVRDRYGTVVASGGPYADNTLYSYSIPVNPTNCYDFCIYDSFGDGICCDYGYGWYEVTYIGVLVGYGDEFGYVECVNDIGDGCCPEAEVVVQVMTDSWPYEITWQLVDQATGVVVCSGGPYASGGTLYTHTCCVKSDGCYDFTIFDSYGDGIYSPGGYAVYYEGALVYSCIGSGYYGYSETVANIGNCGGPDFTVTAPYTSPVRTTCGAGDDCDMTPTSPDHEYQVTIPYASTWNFNTCLHSDLDTMIFVGTALCSMDVGYNDDSCGLQSEVIVDIPAGTYYCTIEHYCCNVCGEYIFDVYDAHGPDYQVTAPYTSPLRSTCGAGDHCNLVTTSPDHEYEVIIPYASTWSFNTCLHDDPNTALDTYIFVGTSLCTQDIGSNDDACGVWGLQSEVLATIPAGTYYCTIEHYCCDYCGEYIFDVYDTLAQPNDDCADAMPIGDVVDLPFDTTNATFDGPGYCQGAPNLWYCYTATCTGMMSVDTCGSQYDTMIAVYDGCECDPIGPMLCCNDDNCCPGEDSTYQSRCMVWVEQGQQYLIEVGGYSSNTGAGDLTVSCQPCEYFFDGVFWQGGGNGWPYPQGPGEWIYYPSGWWNMWWPNEFDLDREKLVRIEFDVEFPCPWAGWLEVAINWTTPDWTDPYDPPVDDAFILRAPDPPIYIVDPGHYEFEMMLPYCPYWVSVDVRGDSYVITGTIFHECQEPEPPPNDHCVNATPIGDVNALPFDTTYATFDGPGMCMTSPNIWYCYTATCTGAATVSLCGSSYDTVLAVYDGCECDPIGTMLCCNDDFCGLQSQCSVPVVAGQEYLIEVGGYSSYTGPGVLTISCQEAQSNDTCDTAWPIAGLPYHDEGNTCANNDDYDEVCPYTDSTSPDVVYVYTPEEDICVDISLCDGSDYDTKLYVYENVCQDPNDGQEPFACNDDACYSPNYPYPYVSRLLGLQLTGGNDYYIVVDGYGGLCGNYVLDVTECVDYWFDSITGDMGGTGWNGEWIYYPDTGWWNMWWPNEFDLERVKVVYVEFEVDFPAGVGWMEFVFNWTTPQWDNPVEPPFDEVFIERGPDPPIFIEEPGQYQFQIILPYCPLWVSVDVRGDMFVIRGTIRHECVCFGDLDGDNCVGLSDLAQLLSNYGCASGCNYWDGDLDCDGDVDLADLAALLSRYGMCCP